MHRFLLRSQRRAQLKHAIFLLVAVLLHITIFTRKFWSLTFVHETPTLGASLSITINDTVHSVPASLSEGGFSGVVVSHKAGLFSQLFVMLRTFIDDVELHGTSSSTFWYIEAYSPAQGSGWERAKFEDIFQPVAVSTNFSLTPSNSYYDSVRARAQQIFRLRPELETALRYYGKQMGVTREQNVCVHLRRGDKQREGIRSFGNEDLVGMMNSMEPNYQTVYLLTDDKVSAQELRHLLGHVNITLVTFPEEQCVQNLTSAQCFAISVFLMTKGVCKQFFGSSTSNVARMVMLLGETFIDLDGVVDYFTSTSYGRWYRPPDHCYVVDGSLQSGEVCGYISPRCQYCVENTCAVIPSCLSHK